MCVSSFNFINKFGVPLKEVFREKIKVNRSKKAVVLLSGGLDS